MSQFKFTSGIVVFLSFFILSCATSKEAKPKNEKVWWHLAMGANSTVNPGFKMEVSRFGVSCVLDKYVKIKRSVEEMFSRYVSCRIGENTVRLIVNCKYSQSDNKHLVIMDKKNDSQNLGMIQLSCKRGNIYF